MIFKGFTDENGNVIPVQGAGTVYNEEKNSLALGKDTVAIGQDQLVFGRYNEEDADKVEIVGGEILDDSIIAGVTNLYEKEGYRMSFQASYPVFYGGRNVKELKSALKTLLNSQIPLSEIVIPESLDKQVSFWFISLQGGTTPRFDIWGYNKESDGWKEETLLFNGTWTLLSDEIDDWIEFDSYEELKEYAASHQSAVHAINYSGYQSRINYITTTISSITPQANRYGTLEEFNGFPVTEDHPISTIAENAVVANRGMRKILQYGNIRTLDWGGNEELAGSLKVGTGITIGETSLSEEELIALKALLNS